MMWYFDTNVLVYSIISVDKAKMNRSQQLIKNCVKSKTFLISPVTLQELVFVLAKLKVDKTVLINSVQSFSKYSKYQMDRSVVMDAFALCGKINNFYRNINDAIHLRFAEKYCEKLLTFDSDF